MKENSLFGKLNQNDLIKGVLVAIFTAIIISVYNGIETNTITFTWAYFKPIILSSIGAGIGYLVKNVFTNSNGVPLNKEIPKLEDADSSPVN